MDPDRFDSFAKYVTMTGSRRSMLRGLLGLGGASIAGVLTINSTAAARRGFAGPLLPNACPGPSCGERCCQVGETCIGGICHPIGELCVPMGQLCPSNFPCCDAMICCDTGAGYSLCSTEAACHSAN
jgi:hypothetical protein